jgi:hypothetical protein
MNKNNKITYTSWKKRSSSNLGYLFPPLLIETFYINAQMLVFYNDLLTCFSNEETECTIGFLTKNRAR